MSSEIVERIALPAADCVGGFPRGSGTFLLDGSEGISRLGSEPRCTFRASRIDERDDRGRRRARVRVTDEHGMLSAITDDPVSSLRALLGEGRIAVGYVGYEAGQMLESLPGRARPSAGMPDIAFSFHDWVIEGDVLIVRGRDRTAAERTRDRVLRALDARSVPSTGPLGGSPCTLVPSVSRDAYLHAVDTAKGHIRRGDAFEICLTMMLEGRFVHDAWDLFRLLRRTNPAPYAAWLDLPEGQIVSSSPERFVRLANGIAESRPIKGTRPRGRDAAEDEQLARDLQTSEKDRAENAMIVDLVRNDLGRICRWGTVEVPELFAVERHPTLHQLVSTVRGELANGRDAIDLLRACFPPGSMTGAPKIEAMTILEGLEPVERGVYSGTLGYIGSDGTMDASVVIRSAVARQGRISVGIGGAIVADSSPEDEHDEAFLKAKAIIDALSALSSECEAA